MYQPYCYGQMRPTPLKYNTYVVAQSLETQTTE